MRERIPDKVYLIIETAVDEIAKELGSSEIRGPVSSFIGKEFQIKLREEICKYEIEKKHESI